MAMLACARIGAPHSVVFGGFSADSLRDRINDAEAKVLITGDGAWRRGSVVPLKETADVAMAECPSIERCLVLRRTGAGRRRCRTGATSGGTTSSRRRSRTARPSRWTPRTSSTSSTRAGRRRSPRGSCTRPAATSPRSRGRTERVRHPARRRRLLVRRRRRLGHRALVHRLRPAREPHDQRHLRGSPRLPRQGPALVDRRAVRRHDPLHRADRDPQLHEVGHRVPASVTTCRRCGCSARVGEPINPEAWVWYWQHIGGGGARSSTRGGRPRPAPS